VKVRTTPFFALPAQRDLVACGRCLPLVEQVVDDVHLAAHAPAGGLDPRRRVVDRGVGARKLDVQIGQRCVPEPGDVAGGARQQFVIAGDAVAIHEGLQVAGRDPVRVGLPGDALAEGKNRFG
jgi:hypothetical protein